MTCDHVGVHLFPQYRLLRIIGRLAMPIFAYMIAEGCRYTKNRGRYLMTIAAFAALCQIVYFVAEKSLYQCILVTFSLSICLIFAIDYAKEKKNIWAWALAAATGLCICFLSLILPQLVKGSSRFAIDYGLWGILLPVFVYFCPATPRAVMPQAIQRTAGTGSASYSLPAARLASTAPSVVMLKARDCALALSSNGTVSAT